MKIKSDKIRNMEVPNIIDVVSSGKRTKSQLETLKRNEVDVIILDNSMNFKQTVIGTLSYLTEIPIVYIEINNDKLGIFVIKDSLIFDKNIMRYTLIVNPSYCHTISLTDLNNVDIPDKFKQLFDKVKFITPLTHDMFKLEEVKLIMKNNDVVQEVKLIPSNISSLGRSKLLERTTVKTNDALIIIGIIALLIGFVLGIISTLIVL